MRKYKITAIDGNTVVLGDIFESIPQTEEWMLKNKPEVGGWYVVTDGGKVYCEPKK